MTTDRTSISDPRNPEYYAEARDAIMNLCGFYDPNHKCAIIRENVFKDCLAELREREKIAKESAARLDALSSAGMKRILQLETEVSHWRNKHSELFMKENPIQVECEECEGTGKRSFYECDELVDCVDCNGTGNVPLASESQREAAETADDKPDGQAENAIAQTPPTAVDLPRLVRQSYFGTVRLTIGCMDRMCQVTYYNDKREKQDIRGTSQEVADHINSLPNDKIQP